MATDDLDDLLGIEPKAESPKTTSKTEATPSSDALDDLLSEEDPTPTVLADEPEPESPVIDEPQVPAAVSQESIDDIAAIGDQIGVPAEAAAPAKRTRRTHADIEAETRAKLTAEIRAQLLAEMSGIDTIPVESPAESAAIADAAVVLPPAGADLPVLAALPDVSQMGDDEAEQAYLASLQARIKGEPSVRPKPESQLTPVQRQIRAAEDQLSRVESDRISTAEPAYEASVSGNILLIHIVNDGLVINGQPVYRGQEFEFDLAGRAYEQTKNKFGESYLALADDLDAQYERWGEQKIASGPWRGKRQNFDAKDAPADLVGADRAQWVSDMMAHQAAEASRSKAAPVMMGSR